MPELDGKGQKQPREVSAEKSVDGEPKGRDPKGGFQPTGPNSAK